MKRTPLYSIHLSLNARMVEFAGWEMPISYTGIVDEHQAVRKAAGIFDIGHMGLLRISGKEALGLIQKATTNNASRLEVGQAQYSILCRPDGGVIDDILVYRLSDGYMLVVNAVNAEQDKNWLQKHALPDSRVEDLKPNYTLLSIQGPKTEAILQKLTDLDLSSIRYYRFKEGKICGIDSVVSRTGYTGEDGFELLFEAAEAPRVWKAIFEEGKELGLKPGGLGARDTLRLEAGLPLYGHEHSLDSTPLEVGVGWTVKFDKGDFIGRAALLKQKEEGLKRKLVGIELLEKVIPREGNKILDITNPQAEIGFITSGTFSPTLGKPIGMGYVKIENSEVGKELLVEIRGRSCQARLVPLPFYRRKSKI